MFEVAVLPFDNAAVFVVGGVQTDRAFAVCTSASAMAFLVVGFRDNGLDTSGAEVAADRAR